jgi:hypothetical protein
VALLIDTCTWIDVEQGALAPADVAMLTRGEPVFLSPVTIAELRFGAEVAKDLGMRQKSWRLYDDFSASRFYRSTAQPEIPLVPSPPRLKAAGRQHRYRVQDLSMDCQLSDSARLTRNRRDFEGVPGLDLTLYLLAEQKRGEAMGKQRPKPAAMLEERVLGACSCAL